MYGQVHGSTFKVCHALLKNAILLSKIVQGATLTETHYISGHFKVILRAFLCKIVHSVLVVAELRSVVHPQRIIARYLALAM